MRFRIENSDPWVVWVSVMIFSVACTGKYVRTTTGEQIERTPERIARGRYLVATVGACGGCHTGREHGELSNPEDPDRLLGGGNWVVDQGFGIYIPNISSDVETGLGAWTDDQIVRAIRDGVGHHDELLFPMMPFAQYQFMSDDDVRAMVAYLRTVPPVKPVLPRRPIEKPFPKGLLLGMGIGMHLPVLNVPAVNPENTIAWGRYQSQLGHCAECHSMGIAGARQETDDHLAGSKNPFETAGVGKVWASNLTPDPETGLGRFSAEQIKASIRSGTRLDGKGVAPPMALLVTHYALMSDRDLDALVAYLKSVPAVKNAVPARALEAPVAQMLGDRKGVAAPPVPERQTPSPDGAPPDETRTALGRQLFTSRGCVACHTLEGPRGSGPSLRGLFGSRVALKEGNSVIADDAYLRESILKPGAALVDGYLPLMPLFQDVLTDDEVDALVAFLRTL